MNDDDPKKLLHDVSKAIGDKKKYVKPSIVSEAIFESAAGCGKADPTQVTCGAVPRSGS